MDDAPEERISSRWQPMVRLEEMVTPRTRIEVTLIAPWRMGAGSQALKQNRQAESRLSRSRESGRQSDSYGGWCLELRQRVVGRDGALAESITFNRRVVGLTPALAVT